MRQAMKVEMREEMKAEMTGDEGSLSGACPGITALKGPEDLGSTLPGWPGIEGLSPAKALEEGETGSGWLGDGLVGMLTRIPPGVLIARWLRYRASCLAKVSSEG